MPEGPDLRKPDRPDADLRGPDLPGPDLRKGALAAPVVTSPAKAASVKAVPVRHPGRWVASVVVLVVLAQVVTGLVRNKNLHWQVVADNLFDKAILQGVVTTLELTGAAMAIGVVLGVVLAVMRLSPNPLVNGLAWLYVYVFRGTPLLVQLIFWFNIALLLPRIGLGVPFGPEFFSEDANTLVTPFIAALLALGLNEGAYMSEIVRAGILSVDDGQAEAASALGMTRTQILRRIVLPQAMRVVVPPTGNETISMLKTSSLASTIAVVDLLRSVQNIYSRTFQVIPLLLDAAFWYLVMSSVLYVGQYYLERRFARGSVRALPPTPLQRVRRLLGAGHAL